MLIERKIYIFLSLFFLVILVGSCRKKEAAVEFKAVPLEKNCHTYNTDFYHISVEYPLEIWDYNHDMQQYVESVVAFYKRDWSPGGMHYEKEMSFRDVDDEKEYPKRELYVRFQKYSAARLNIHSYLFSSYAHSGGANGTTVVAAFNFNQNGMIEYDELFSMTSEQEISLTRLLAQQLKDSTSQFDPGMVQQGLGLAYISAEDGSLDSLSMKKRDFTFKSNFSAVVLADTGIHFHFDKYALAPGSSGTTSIFLSWEQVRPYLGSEFRSN